MPARRSQWITFIGLACLIAAPLQADSHPLPHLTIGWLDGTRATSALRKPIPDAPVILSARAFSHIAARHPGDFWWCLASLERALINPTFYGLNPKHPQNFQLYAQAPTGEWLLIPLSQRPDHRGHHRIRTCFRLAPSKMPHLLREGWLSN